ncbi:MAG: DNA double-strand break repair nuclease NurA [Thermoproteota archaeon]
MEENPLLTLPRPVIEAFFKCAEEESLRARERIKNLEQRLNWLKSCFKFAKVDGFKVGRIVAIDGSMTSTASERLGSEFGIYTAGYMVFDGKKLIDEKYVAGSLSWTEGLRSFHTLLRLLMAYAERKLALEAYWRHGPDYILLDGPFFYFRSHCRYIREVEIGVDGIGTGLDLIRRVRDMTVNLMRMGRAVCIIKRSRIRAIDGWILYHKGEEACIGTKDKHILTVLMPAGSTWSYGSLLDEDPLAYAALYRFYRRWRQVGKPAEELRGRMDDLMEQVRKDWARKFEVDLDVDLSKLPRAKRYYVRYSPTTPPFEIEAVEETNVEDFAKYFSQFYNPASGLPLPLDLVDSAIMLPRGSTTAFTREVEARLIADREIPDKQVISDYFTYLNPQKEEYV